MCEKVKFDLEELRELIHELGYSLKDLDNIEILSACTNTSCETACQQSCQSGCSNRT